MTFSFCPSADLFATLFPFHLILNRDLEIIQVGPVLHRLYPSILSKNKDFREHFWINKPDIIVSFETIKSQANTLFLIGSRDNNLEFKGQMLYVASSELIIFVGSPVIRDLSKLSNYGLKLSDFLAHDPMTDLIFLIETQAVALFEAKYRTRKLAMQQAKTREALLQEQELSELKTRFINTASHEFRTPLGVISSSAGLLEDYGEKLNAEKKSKHFKQIQGSVKHMTNLLEDVLLINQSESGKLECKKSSIDLIDFCNEIVDEMTTFNDAENRFIMSIDSQLDIQDGFSVFIDRKLVRQILINLLSNALKYSFPDTKIHFKIQVELHQIAFRVTDRGIGITAEDRVKLFESFHRGSNVSNIQGTGLGLSIVKRCVDIHGGTIDLTSEVNVGSTFTVSLPLDDLA